VIGFLLVLGSLRDARAQAPSELKWTVVASDTTGTEWMDTSAVKPAGPGQVLAWFKLHPAHEPQLTVVHYRIDCVGFRLSLLRALTYDTTGTQTTDVGAPTPFYAPPPFPALQDFMRRACVKAQGDTGVAPTGRQRQRRWRRGWFAA
jgi:hypothetical protein